MRRHGSAIWFARSLGAAAACAALAASAVSASDSPTAPERPIHRFLAVEISPDAALVASIEGDSPVGGYYPLIRDLVIRRTDTRRRDHGGPALRPCPGMLARLADLESRRQAA